MLILTFDHTQKVWSEVYTERVVSFLDPSMKNNTASIKLKSTRVGTIPLEQNHRCACPINYPSAYSGKHINSPWLQKRQPDDEKSNFIKLVKLFFDALQMTGER